MTDVQIFIREIISCIYFFCSLFLVFTWLSMHKGNKAAREDYGLILLAMYLFFCIITNIYKNTYIWGYDNLACHILSTFQNCFLFASLSYFDKLNTIFKNSFNKILWAVSMIVLGALITSVIVIIPPPLKKYFDFIYSVLAVGGIGAATVYTFYKRRCSLPLLLLSSFFSFGFMYVQKFIFYDKYEYNFDTSLLISMNIIFVINLLILAQTWVTEKLMLSKDEEIKEVYNVANNYYSNVYESPIPGIPDNIINQDTDETNEMIGGGTNESDDKTALKSSNGSYTAIVANEIPGNGKNIDIAGRVKMFKKNHHEVLKDIFFHTDKSTYKEIGLRLHRSEYTIISRMREIERILGIKGKDKVVDALYEVGFFEEKEK